MSLKGVRAVTEPGTLSLGENDVIHLGMEGEQYQINARDVRQLLFFGREVPLNRTVRIRNEADDADETISIEGHAGLNRSGKAVIVYTREGHYIIPLVSFQRVARGEAVSAPLLPLMPDHQEGTI